jgi:hypothetical protein
MEPCGPCGGALPGEGALLTKRTTNAPVPSGPARNDLPAAVTARIARKRGSGPV